MHLNADLTTAEVSKQTGAPGHQIRYILKKFESQEFIHQIPFIDTYRLGLVNYGVLLAVGTEHKSIHHRLVAMLKNSEQVSFLSELGGSYQYQLQVCGKDALQIAHFLDTLVRTFGPIFHHKRITTRLSLHDYPLEFLFGRPQQRRTIHFGLKVERQTIDNLDHQILCALSSQGLTTMAEIARTLGVPMSSLELRMKRLRAKKILIGSRYLLDNSVFGVHNYVILVNLRGLSSALRDNFADFCAQHRNIRYMMQNLGGWDFEIGSEVIDPREMASVSKDIYEKFGTDIREIEVLPVFNVIKVVNYPFKNYPWDPAL